MNGRSSCCDAVTVRDDTGDIICTACGLILDNNQIKEETKDE